MQEYTHLKNTHDPQYSWDGELILFLCGGWGVSSCYIEKLSLPSYFSSRFVGNEISDIIQYSSLIKKKKKKKEKNHVRTSSIFFFFFFSSFLHIEPFIYYLTIFVTFSFISPLYSI